MTSLSSFLAILRELAIVGAIAGFFWPVWQFFAVRRQQARDREFEIFHRLIKELVQPPEKHDTMFVERQMAVVYELRNFPRYREVTGRMLKNLREFWSATGNKALLREIDLTLAYLERGK
jgi:hypothetical protein